MKKILLFTRPLVPPWDEGSKNLAFEIARHNAGNFEFHLLSDNSPALKKEFWPEKKRVIKIEPIFSSPKLNWRNKLNLIKRLFQLESEIHLIHFLFTPRPLTSRLFSWKLKNGPIKTVQTIAVLDEKIIQDPNLAKKVLFADLIIAQSKHTLGKLGKLGLNAHLIYPGIDLEKFQPQPKNQKMLSQFKLSKDDFVLLFAGEYDRLEAIDDILSAFQIIKKNNQAQNLKLILACRLKTEKDQKIKKTTQEKVIQNGWEENFVFLDFAQDMVALYNLADLNIFPVRKMAGKFDVPLALIEAMACEKTVLVSDLPVLTELIQDNENGLVVPRANPQALAEKIIWLKNNPAINQNLALAGRSTVQEKFNIQNIANQYQAVYEDLLKK